MLKKTITFKDLDDNPISEDFYFNLSKAELTEMELGHKSGLSDYMEKIVKEEDAGKLIMLFKDIIIKAVGRRSEDGRRFIKSQEITDDFMQTDAYSELFMELGTKADAAVEFITAIVPKDLVAEVEALQAEKTPATETLELPASDVSSEKKTSREIFLDKMKDPTWVPTQQDLMGIDQDLFQMAFQRKQASTPTQ